MATKLEAQLELRVFLFPFLSPGNMIPLLEVATLLSHRGVSATIVTTPANEPFFKRTIRRSNSTSSKPINLVFISFPLSTEVPYGKENLYSIPSSSFTDLFHATFSLYQPLLNLLQLHRPDCIIFDIMYHWVADIAEDLSIPAITFRTPGIFALCVEEYLETYTPFQKSDAFTIEGLPHRIELTKSKILETFLVPGLQEMRREAENKSFGIIVNSFYELEPEYADLFREKPTCKAWIVGPVTLSNKISAHDWISNREEDEEWIKWIESKSESSVLYVCFGSLLDFNITQLDEIGAALNDSGYPFIWVVRNCGGWQPPKNIDTGKVITGWASQTMILNHPSVGGFLTHCGSNSILEAIVAGKPLIGWPLMHEQFINEKLVTEVLKIGVRVEIEGGNVLLNRLEGKEDEMVGREEIRRAVENLMGGGDKAKEMRKRVNEYREKAKKAMTEGGSSYEDLSILIDDLKDVKEKSTGIVLETKK